MESREAARLRFGVEKARRLACGDPRTVLAQLLDHLPRHRLRRIAARYGGDHGIRRFTTWDHFLTMAFAQLTRRESLRDIEACLGAVSDKLYRSGLRSGPVARSTLADANERRDWRIFAEFGQTLIQDTHRLYTGEPRQHPYVPLDHRGEEARRARPG